MKKLLIILVLLIAFPAWSATYYIKTGGNDASAGTSDETAWATTARVMATTGYSNIVTSGDTVYFRSQDTWSSSGTPLVLNATAGVTYDGSTYGSGTRAKFVGTAGANSGVYEVVRIFVSNVIFKGFEIDGGAKYDTIGINVGHRVSADIANVTIQNCVVHNVGDNNSNGWPYGIIISSGDGHTTSNVTVIDNEVYDTARGGLNLYASWTTANNKVTGVTVRNNYVHGAGRYFNASGMDICNDIENSTIEYNVLSDSGSGIAIRVSPSGEGPENVTTAPTNVTIRYNLIRHNKIFGIFYQVDDRGLPFLVHIYGNLFVDNGYNANNPADGAELRLDLGSSESVFNVYNNTFYTTTNPNRNQSGMILLGLGDLSDTGATINFKNNIVYADISSSDETFRTIWDRWGVLAGTHSNNLIYRSSGASDLLVFDKNTSSYNRSTLTNWEATAKNTNPAFSGGTLPTGFSGTYGTNMVPNTDYFQLTTDSPAKDTGATLASYTGCINGAGLTTPITRPVGSAYDIGAYEYGTAGASGSSGSGFFLQGVTIR